MAEFASIFREEIYTPQIAVLASARVTETLAHDRVKLHELLQPFAKLSNELYFRSPLGTKHQINNFKLRFIDATRDTITTHVAREHLMNAVIKTTTDVEMETIPSTPTTPEITTPTWTPWYDAWRSTFVRVQPLYEHEFLKHSLAVIVAVSADDTAQTALELTQKLSTIHGLHPSYLKYYLIVDALHVDDALYRHLSTLYGRDSCHVLHVHTSDTTCTLDVWTPFVLWQNFQTHAMPREVYVHEKDTPNVIQDALEEDGQQTILGINNPPVKLIATELTVKRADERDKLPLPLDDENRHVDGDVDGCASNTRGSKITVRDIFNIQEFILKFCNEALLTHFERETATLHQNVMSKIGVSHTLLSATKRLFGPSKPTTVPAVKTDTITVQLRQLADIYLLFGVDELALKTYQTARREYYADQACTWYAGLLEMIALTGVLNGDFTKKTFDVLEECLVMYMTKCHAVHLATRTIIVAYEYLRESARYSDAIKYLLLLFEPDSDLISALLLEQAAYCCMQMRPRKVRKYGLYIVLAAFRYAKALQRTHSLRCYRQAFQIYQHSGFDFTRSHVNFSMAREASRLNMHAEAIRIISALYQTPSKHTPAQERQFIKLLMDSYKALDTDEELPHPIINLTNVKVIVTHARPTHDDNVFDDTPKWLALEECLVTYARRGRAFVFEPTPYVYVDVRATKHVCVGEVVRVIFDLTNTTNSRIQLTNATVLWTVDGRAEQFTESNAYAQVAVEQNFDAVDELSHAQLVVRVIARVTGTLRICGVKYTVTWTDALSSSESFTGVKWLTDDPGPLEFRVIDNVPSIEVTLNDLPTDVHAGQIAECHVTIKNVGDCALRNVHCVTSLEENIIWPKRKRACVEQDDFLTDEWTHAHLEQAGFKFAEQLTHGTLEPSTCSHVTFLMHAPQEPGALGVDFLFYYEHNDAYRLLRVTKHVNVVASVTYSSDVAACVDRASLIVTFANDHVFTLHSFWMASTNWTIEGRDSREISRGRIACVRARKLTDPKTFHVSKTEFDAQNVRYVDELLVWMKRACYKFYKTYDHADFDALCAFVWTDADKFGVHFYRERGEIEENPTQTDLQHEFIAPARMITHAFNVTPVKRVPMTLRVTNTTACALELMIEFDAHVRPVGQFSTDDMNVDVDTHVTYECVARARVDAYESRDFALRAFVCAPGFFNMNGNVRFLVDDGSGWQRKASTARANYFQVVDGAEEH